MVKKIPLMNNRVREWAGYVSMPVSRALRPERN
jgi:hypothetical protein